MSVDKDLDLILEPVINAAIHYQAVDDGAPSLDAAKKLELKRTQAKADLIKWAEELVDRVIGRNEESKYGDGLGRYHYTKVDGQNALRATQRKRAKDIFKEIK